MQHDNMKLHAILSKFHIEHTQNGATVQHTHTLYKFKGQAVQNRNYREEAHNMVNIPHMNKA